MDIASLQLGQSQYINREKGTNNMLYFTVFRMDPSYRAIDITFTIEIDITSPALFCLGCCYSCNGGSRRFPSSKCLCYMCPPGLYGPDCSINMLTLTKGQTTTVMVNGPKLTFFRIN